VEKPSQEVIDRIKAKFPSQSLHRVTLRLPGGDEEFCFVMVGPDADQYKTYSDEVTKARENAKSDLDRNERLAFAAKSAALRQTQWPEREELKTLLHAKPGFVHLLAEQIHEHAGSTAEVRSEKL
jgi:hypothetical protein